MLPARRFRPSRNPRWPQPAQWPVRNQAPMSLIAGLSSREARIARVFESSILKNGKIVTSHLSCIANPTVSHRSVPGRSSCLHLRPLASTRTTEQPFGTIIRQKTTVRGSGRRSPGHVEHGPARLLHVNFPLTCDLRLFNHVLKTLRKCDIFLDVPSVQVTTI